MNEFVFKRGLPLAEIYRNLYPWRNINEFFDVIKNTIAYKSEDNSLIAISKPFGVGTYASHDKNSAKQNQDRLFYRLHGQAHYSMQDILKPFADEFQSKEPYKVIKGIDRYMSGLILISNNYQAHYKQFLSSISASKSHNIPPYGFRALTSGYPIIKSNKISERVGFQLLEIDELGDHKEPVIVPKPSKSFKEKHSRDKKVSQVELEVKKINQEYSVSLIELYISKLLWDFPRCYISSKTAFILGDVRFSKRIREVLGKPIQVSAFKSSQRYCDNYEPLNAKLRNFLGVDKNSSIPLMLDLYTLRLKHFHRGRAINKDLTIQSPCMPTHFALTAEKLKLLESSSVK